MDSKIRDYALITGNYWAFTLTDGALRMLVVLHFHILGFTPFEIASLFLFYEFFGIVTNAVGGWLGARIGLNRTMQIGLLLQVAALSMLLVPEKMLTVVWVMVAQALSGIAKDLNKMSAKSSMKTIARDQDDGLYRIVAFLTGSKNALKGAGFFIGAVLLSLFEFRGAVTAMVLMLALVWLMSLLLLRQELGVMKNKPKFSQIFSKSSAVNWLSFARFFLFGARDVWFVVALPVFLYESLQWDFWQVGGYLAKARHHLNRLTTGVLLLLQQCLQLPLQSREVRGALVWEQLQFGEHRWSHHQAHRLHQAEPLLVGVGAGIAVGHQWVASCGQR